MTDPPRYTRRRLLGGLAVGTVGTLAGCSDTIPDAGPTESSESDASESADDAEPDGSASSELDLREANVVGVEATVRESGYEFTVALHHDDDGEDGYADWWQIERLDGTRLGRRELVHAHSTQPFERSETIDVPGEIECVVVRGHDQTHGYGGQALILTLQSGATRTVSQGAEPDRFDDVECP